MALDAGQQLDSSTIHAKDGLLSLGFVDGRKEGNYISEPCCDGRE